MAGALGRFSFATAAEKRLKQQKYCKKHCFLVVGLEKVVGMCTYNRHRRAWPHKSNRSDKDCWSEGSVKRKLSVSFMN